MRILLGLMILLFWNGAGAQTKDASCGKLELDSLKINCMANSLECDSLFNCYLLGTEGTLTGAVTAEKFGYAIFYGFPLQQVVVVNPENFTVHKHVQFTEVLASHLTHSYLVSDQQGKITYYNNQQ